MVSSLPLPFGLIDREDTFGTGGQELRSLVLPLVSEFRNAIYFKKKKRNLKHNPSTPI